MAEKLVRYETIEGIARLTLCDPPLNAYTHEMMRDLDDAILKARFDDAVHVILLTGAGDKFFCPGANVEMLKAVDPSFKYYFCMHANETLTRLENTP
ncbi:MAG: enoyl-CoA hydratase/isomerase family protein, partial [Planctomycetes bacterium]|nr:enoyl-CoA hydratase/isomerase family protein [Planctomycetota bacterium]